MNCSIVIPVYNSDASLVPLVEKILATCEPVIPAFEVILVNDGSRDGSWDTIQNLAKRFSQVRGINLMRNYGQHNALLAGIRAARYQVIVTMDDDGQHPPDQIPALLAKLDEGFDVVYGAPEVTREGFWRIVGSQITRFLIVTTMGVRVPSNGSSFRAFRTMLREGFADYVSPFVAIDVLLSWGTTRFGVVTVKHEARRVGKSNYSFIGLLILAVDMTTGFSTWPLRVASFVGFVFTVIGAVVFLYTLIRYLVEGGDVPNLRFLGSIISIFAGAQLFALGIMGEYLARLHSRMMARPPYVIRERTDPQP